MLKRLVAIILICFTAQHAAAKELPDFTELVEKQSAAVVNINITQTVHDTQGMLANEFHRTVSRIIEMQSREYMEAPRRDAADAIA